MARYDVLDEALVEATPAEVEAALNDETYGRAHWWRPWMHITPLDDSGRIQIGATMRFSVDNPASHVRWMLPRFTGRVVAYEPERHIMFDYIKGAFRGTGEWVMEETDDSHTRISFRWVASPVGSTRLMAHLVDVPKMHSRIMQKGYKGLDRHLAAIHTRATT